MRQILVDHARRRNASKREAILIAINPDELAAEVPAACFELAALDDSLERLSQIDPRLGQITEAVVDMKG